MVGNLATNIAVRKEVGKTLVIFVINVMLEFMLNIVDYIVSAYKQKTGEKLPENISIVSLDGIDYCNRVYKETNDRELTKIPALILDKDNSSELLVNTTALTGEYRVFSTEVFLSVLAKRQIEESENFKKICQKKRYLLKEKYDFGLDIIKTFFANIASLKVMNVLFENSEYSYEEKSIYQIKNILQKTEHKTSVLCYMLSKIRFYSPNKAHDLLSDMPVCVLRLYDALIKIDIKGNISKRDIIKINKLASCY